MISVTTKKNNLQAILFPILDTALNGLNYIFHIYVSWYLIPTNYGVFNALLSIAAILLVLGIAFQTYTASRIAENNNDIMFIKKMLKLGSVFVAIVFLVALSLIKPISALTRGNTLAIFLTIGIFAVNTPLSVMRGYIQGKKEFLLLNINFYIEVGIKTIVLVTLLPVFKNIEIGLGGIFLGMLMALIHSFRYVSKSNISFRIKKSTFRFKNIINSFTEINEMLKKCLGIIIANFCIYYLTSIDMLMINYFLPGESGVFAVVLRYGQIIISVAFSIITVIIPIASGMKKDLDLFYKRMKQFVTAIIIAEIVGVIGYALILTRTIPVMFGEGYSTAADYLVFGAVAYFLLVLSFFIVNMNIVLGNRDHMKYLIGTAVILTLELLIVNQSIKEVFMIEIFNYSILTILLIKNFFRKGEKNEEKY